MVGRLRSNKEKPGNVTYTFRFALDVSEADDYWRHEGQECK